MVKEAIPNEWYVLLGKRHMVAINGHRMFCKENPKSRNSDRYILPGEEKGGCLNLHVYNDLVENAPDHHGFQDQ